MDIASVIAEVPEKIAELQQSFSSGAVVGDKGGIYLSQYILWMFIAIAILLVVVFAAKRRMTLVPQSKFANAVEALVEFVRKDVGEGVVGKGYERHLPFLLTIFFFILFNNLLGLIPGAKPGTGTISVTAALSLVAFVYFNIYGMKEQGVGRYWLNLAPKGIILPLAIVLWFIELFSLFLRLMTLAIRLFANMYAGHIVLGAFALLTTLFLTPLIQQGISSAALITALPSVIWMLLLVLMYAMELLVAVIQAYVFVMLTGVYIQIAGGEE